MVAFIDKKLVDQIERFLNEKYANPYTIHCGENDVGILDSAACETHSERKCSAANATED